MTDTVRMHELAVNRDERRRRREDARQRGACLACCLRMPAPGRKSCATCLDRKREAYRAEVRP
jgi:hypothetical protein